MQTASKTETFKKYLTEALSTSSVEKAAFIITKYLKKQTGKVFFRYPGLEQYKSGDGFGFGLRFYTPKKNVSLRFNWKQSNLAGLNNLSSVDYWDGKAQTPFHIEFDQSVSLVKTLPIIADIVASGTPTLGSITTMPDEVPLYEAVLTEANSKYDFETIFDEIVDYIVDPNFIKSKIYSMYGVPGVKIFDSLSTAYSNFIEKQGIKYVWVGTKKDLKRIKDEKGKIMARLGIVSGTITKGPAVEKYVYSPEVEEIEADRERLSFEAQLKDLENLVKLTINGAANALFVSGKGGVGKTHTTEKILSGMGLSDGNGYFKNTGSASAAGIYSLLFRYRNDIIFFDDSDDALGDQEARNLLKAATDTKKIRKLVWNKMGKNVVDPEGDMTDDEILDNGLIPRYFEFTGKIIFISNLKLDKLDPDGALRTRAFIIDIDPTEIEIYDFMDKIVGDMKLEDGLKLDQKSRLHVVDLLRKGKSKQSANLRKLSRGLNMAAGALAAGVEVADDDLKRMIETYA
jgi:hypothetical protein